MHFALYIVFMCVFTRVYWVYRKGVLPCVVIKNVKTRIITKIYDLVTTTRILSQNLRYTHILY